MREAQETHFEEEEDTQRGKFLTFSLDREQFGIEIRYVTEIIGMQEIVPVPELPDYLKGIVNLRGRIIPVMDVRLRFKKPSRDYTDRTCIIIIDYDAFTVGLIVDAVSEVLAIADDQIVPPPQLNRSSQNQYIRGISKTTDSVKLLLDCGKLLTEEDTERLDHTTFGG